MKLLALIPLLLIGATAQAANIDIGKPSTITTGPNDKWYFFPPEGYTTVTFPVDNARPVEVPSTKGRLPATLNQKAGLNVGGLGAAALNLAKRAGPIGLGLTLAGLLCEQTDICSTPSDPQNPSSPPVFTVTAPESKPVPYTRWKTGTGYGSQEFETYTQACDVVGPAYIQRVTVAGGSYSSGSVTGCFLYTSTQAWVNIQLIDHSGRVSNTQEIAANRLQNCPTTHNYTGGPQCIPKDPNKRVPLSPTGWPAPEDVPGLNDPGIVPDLINGNEPIPINPPEIDPKTIPGGSTTETVRDGNGNPIGTKTTDTVITITPSGPTTVEVTETTTTTETNITNNTTTTTVTNTNLPNNEDQSEKPKEDQDIEIDDVQDKDLETYEVPDTFSYESWGGGSCPGDPAVSVLGKSLVIPVHTVCDGLTMLRPVVLIIAALASAFIIVGAVKE